MKITKAIPILIISTIIVAVILSAWNSDRKNHQQSQNLAQQNNPCPDSKPCMELISPEGKTYKLNDFRFLPGHCIVILSLPDHTSRNICGDYKLLWIGPDTSKDIKGAQY